MESFSCPISAIFSMFSLVLSPSSNYLPCPHPFLPLSLSLSFSVRFELLVYYFCLRALQPAGPAFLSLSLSLLSPCSPPTWSINTCYRPAGSRPKRERRREREKEGVIPRERENTKNKDPKKMRQKRGVITMRGHWELSPGPLCQNNKIFARGYQCNAPWYES